MHRRETLRNAAVVGTLGLAGCLHGPDGAPEGPIDGFRTVWRTDNAGRSRDDEIQLPLDPSGEYDFRVAWGDGSADRIQRYDAENATHSYDQPGEYAVRIDGTLDGWYFNVGNTGPNRDGLKLLEIREWGGFDVTSIRLEEGENPDNPETDFAGAENLTISADDRPALETGNSLDNLFRKTGISTGTGVSKWDVSGVEYMSRVFADTPTFDDDVSTWDVSNVIQMSGMFSGASSFAGDVSDWDVSNVIWMHRLFSGASSFDGDLSDWEVSAVMDMSEMFVGADLSTRNYDRMLLAWQHLDLQQSVPFGVGETQYSPGEPADARQFIIDEYEWDISDGGEAG